MRARDFAPSSSAPSIRERKKIGARSFVQLPTYLLDLYYLYSDLETFVWSVCCKTTS